MEINDIYMKRCLQLARKGMGMVAPNPMVGAVIVHEGRIIGEGYHRALGEAHAEVNAVHSVACPELLKKSTLYVNLEPCSHYGKTPPCAELIIRMGIPRVVVGQIDPFPQVAGRGVAMLQAAGVDVTTGVLEAECEELNKRFNTFNREGRPYIVLKWAQSADGYIDRHRASYASGVAVRFSDEYTQMLVHKLRAEESAIMVGRRTEELDRPQLNVRYWSGVAPEKVIPRSDIPLREQMHTLYERKLQSLIVEGGGRLLQSFIDADLWDEARVEVAEMELTEGVPAPVLSGALESVQKCKKTIILDYRRRKKP